MPAYDVAHIREQGVDLIIVPLNWQFGGISSKEQSEIVNNLQIHATAAGLHGTVVPVWEDPSGHFNWIAPTPWHPFFRGINMYFVQTNLNRRISWE